MAGEPPAPPPATALPPHPLQALVAGPRSRLARALGLLALIALPQIVLFGPSLVGARVLLPLDILEQHGIYMPVEANVPSKRPIDFVLADLVFELEHQRRYAAESIRSGRIPLWIPYNYCGTPFLAANHTSVFYPLRVLDYLYPGPITIAWVQLAKSLLAGVGAYLFLRRVLGASYWAAAFGAALWPNVGFLVLWAGFTISQVGAHLPWMLLAADETLRRPKSHWPAVLALVTCVVLVSGHASIAAHVLLATGLFALFRLVDLHGVRGLARRQALGGAGAIVLAWGTGFLLSGPQTLPTLEYVKESWRIQKRQEGRIETPSVGIAALPAVAMPYWLGSTQTGAILTSGGNRPEGPQAAYAGLLALLVLAPLAFVARRTRRFAFFWLALGFLGLSQVLGVPLVEQFFELPGLNTLRNNRFTLVTAWSLVALAALGLDLLLRGEFTWRRVYWVPFTAAAALAVVCIALGSSQPALLATAESDLRAGIQRWGPPLNSLEGIQRLAYWFSRMHLGYAVLGALAAALWFLLRRERGRVPVLALGIGALALAEVVQQGYGVNVQCDPALYFPRTAVLDKLASLPPGRMCAGRAMLPAVLNQTQKLHDIRGYDAADPARYVELLELFRNERSMPPSDYAALQYFHPHLPSPLADMLGLRYVLMFGAPPQGALFSAGGWSIFELPNPLPRAFVPARAELANDKRLRLAALARAEFDPRQVVYLELAGPLPADAVPASGEARIVRDEPEEVVLALDIRAPGWLVLADRWAPGWNAWVDGAETEVVLANHTLRAVRVGAGAKELVFRYQPASWRNGLVAFGAGLVLLLAWCAWVRRTCAPVVGV